jgi:hypothetical protein
LGASQRGVARLTGITSYSQRFGACESYSLEYQEESFDMPMTGKKKKKRAVKKTAAKGAAKKTKKRKKKK